MLNSIGRVRNVELSTLRVYNVLACFIHHVSCLDTVLTTRIELLGQVAERVPEDKQFKSHHAGSNKSSNKPAANAAESTPNKAPKGEKNKSLNLLPTQPKELLNPRRVRARVTTRKVENPRRGRQGIERLERQQNTLKVHPMQVFHFRRRL
eukprot:5906866-Amphidinium_carterae.1